MTQKNIAIVLDWYRTLKSGKGQRIKLTTYTNGKPNTKK